MSTFDMRTAIVALRLLDMVGEVREVGGDEPEPLDMRFRYSGRGMYGTECLAVVSGSLGVFGFSILLADAISAAKDVDETEAALLLREMNAGRREDSMGRGTVWYWPEIRILTGQHAAMAE